MKPILIFSLLAIAVLAPTLALNDREPAPIAQDVPGSRELKTTQEPTRSQEPTEPASQPATKPAPKNQPKKASKPSTSDTYRITFYCACEKCCGKTDGITASGTKATANRTVAAPKNFDFGTQIRIDGLGHYVVEDRGGAIKDKRIDVYVDSHEEALQLGVQYREVERVHD